MIFLQSVWYVSLLNDISDLLFIFSVPLYSLKNICLLFLYCILIIVSALLGGKVITYQVCLFLSLGEI